MSRGIGERGVFDCGPGNALPRRRILPEKRRHGNRGHQEEGAASRRVANARPTPPSQRVDTGEKNGDQGALPEKGGEGPAQTPEERVCQKGSEVSHRISLSRSSKIVRSIRATTLIITAITDMAADDADSPLRAVLTNESAALAARFRALFSLKHLAEGNAFEAAIIIGQDGCSPERFRFCEFEPCGDGEQSRKPRLGLIPIGIIGPQGQPVAVLMRIASASVESTRALLRSVRALQAQASLQKSLLPPANRSFP